MNMKIDRKWAMPNKWTFKIAPIHVLIYEEIKNLSPGIDPFSGAFSPADIRNDLNPESNAQTHLDALEFLKSQAAEAYEYAFYDPPYSLRQAAECYKSFGKELQTATVTSMAYWASVKDEIARVLRLNGKVLCFGWNSMGLGKTRGFEMTRILLVPHGGNRNDTICTVEIKNCDCLSKFKILTENN